MAVDENTPFGIQFTAQADLSLVTLSQTGDSSRFIFDKDNVQNGVLVVVPDGVLDFETPQDADHDNVYRFQISASFQGQPVGALDVAVTIRDAVGDPFETQGSVAAIGVSGSSFASSIDAVGDIDGDGKGDLLIGSPTESKGPTPSAADRGVAARLFLGAAFDGSDGRILDVRNHTSSKGVSFVRERTFDNSGSTLRGVGDIDGDGIPDVVIQQPAFENVRPGMAQLVFGSAIRSALAGSGAVDLFNFSGPGKGVVIQGYFQPPNGFSSPIPLTARAVAPAGDVDGDGIRDLLVTTPQGLTPAGAFFDGEIYLLSGARLRNAAATNRPVRLGNLETDGDGVRMPNAPGFFGAAPAGDIDGDGLADVLVSAPTGGGAGQAVIIFGSTLKAELGAGGDKLMDLQDVSLPGLTFALTPPAAQVPVFTASIGAAIAPAGDMNGDGLADFWAATRDSAYLVYGSAAFKNDADGLAAVEDLVSVGQAVALDGYAQIPQGNPTDKITMIGDLDGDGRREVVLAVRPEGSTLQNTVKSATTYVVFSRALTPGSRINLATVGAATPGVKIISSTFWIRFSDSQSSVVVIPKAAGDVDGDGRDDLALAVPRGKYAITLAGRTYESTLGGKPGNVVVISGDKLIAAAAAGGVIDVDASYPEFDEG